MRVCLCVSVSVSVCARVFLCVCVAQPYIRRSRYRKLLGNRSWEPTTSFAEIVRGALLIPSQCERQADDDQRAQFSRGFPAPLLSLRTLKAPLVVGLQSSALASLDHTHGGSGDASSSEASVHTDWRVRGTFGTIHYVPLLGVGRDAELL